ncbi:glycosyltransferase family 2 protein [Massilia sp. S19_KUP03_FR1]|uniref:glycosyltransferase family 2 protein n=1 Tax=Massilia sp. S19_KUP03_FR1 TaxID=3025503 RepID=UPI002FCD9483
MDSTAPSITLVIPTFNRGNLIAATLDSAIAQAVSFLEIIVVDDGSRDDTAAVLALYAGRVQVITVANGGVQRARNIGVAAARGEFIVLCDSDDLLEPGYVAAMQAWLEAHPGCDSVYSNFVTFDEQGVHADKFAGAPVTFFAGARRDGAFWHAIPDLYRRTLAYQPLFPSGSLIRRSVYTAIGGYDPQFNGVGAEDYEFTLRLIDHTDIVLCTTPLVRVRKHAGNDSTDNIRQVRGCVQILEFALEKHPGAARHRAAILESIDVRRLDIFNGAFARGTFDIAADALARLRMRPANLKFQVKVMLMKLPAFLRRPLWKMTQ